MAGGVGQEKSSDRGRNGLKFGVGLAEKCDIYTFTYRNYPIQSPSFKELGLATVQYVTTCKGVGTSLYLFTSNNMIHDEDVHMEQDATARPRI